MIGMLMLIGIVVTNAIVLIDRVIHKEAEVLSTRSAPGSRLYEIASDSDDGDRDNRRPASIGIGL